MSHLKLLVDREHEMALFMDLLKGELPYQILNIGETGGKGKSFLVRAFQQKCKEIKILCSLIEFTSNHPISPVDCMRDIVDSLGESHFPEFDQQDIEIHRRQPVIQIGGGENRGEVSLDGSFQDAEIDHVAGRDIIAIDNIRVVNQDFSPSRQLYIERVLTKVFKKELQNLCRLKSVVIIFDGVEHIPSATANWLWKHLLISIREGNQPRLLLVLSGRQEGNRPNFTPTPEWSQILYEITAFEEFRKEHVLAYFLEKLNLSVEVSEIEAYYRVCKNNPLIMGQIGDILYSETWLTQ